MFWRISQFCLDLEARREFQQRSWHLGCIKFERGQSKDKGDHVIESTTTTIRLNKKWRFRKWKHCHRAKIYRAAAPRLQKKVRYSRLWTANMCFRSSKRLLLRRRLSEDKFKWIQSKFAQKQTRPFDQRCNIVNCQRLWQIWKRKQT